MVVKDRIGRRRYIAFTVNPAMDKTMLISALRRVCGEPPYVIQCGEGWCIIRCAPKDVDTSVAAMTAADPSSSSLRTSGTLSTLRERYPELKRLRPPRKM
jgi:RNase P/RNase MRP subunit POP5